VCSPRCPFGTLTTGTNPTISLSFKRRRLVADEVALFVDLENIVFSLWNKHQQESNPHQWMQKARQYGRVTFARAYGDFSQDVIGRLERQLHIAGIDTVSCPAKVKDNGTQSTVDINVVIDLIEVALDRPNVTVFVLMAGDSDYIRIVSRLRHRWGKRVIVSGIPGTVSRDLVDAAGEEDPLEVAEQVAVDERELIRVIHRYQSELKPGIYPTFLPMKRYVAHRNNAKVIDPNQVQSKLSQFIQRGVLVQEVVELPDGQKLKSTHLNQEDPLVQSALAIGLS
jgi:uncharacterized LabA/DUF88 family protein